VRVGIVSAVRGAAAGIVATAAMSACMIGLERAGVMPGQPPRMIVDRLAPELSERTADAVALTMHAAYGAAAGAVFAQVAGGRRAPMLGAVYGFLVWAAGYEGWVPMLGVLPPAHRDRRSRAATMMLAHLVYGYVLGRQLR
jgi:hypothetical protein